VKNREYVTLYDFRRDVELMVDNATTYNSPDNIVHTFALDVRKVFEAQWQTAILEYDVIDEPPPPVQQV
jgi:hypothetical protein